MKKETLPKQYCTHCGILIPLPSTYSICPKCKELKKKYKQFYGDYKEKNIRQKIKSLFWI